MLGNYIQLRAKVRCTWGLRPAAEWKGQALQANYAPHWTSSDEIPEREQMLSQIWKAIWNTKNQHAVNSQFQYLSLRSFSGNRPHYSTWCNGKLLIILTRARWWVRGGWERGREGGLSLLYLGGRKGTLPPHCQAAICRALWASLLRNGSQHHAWYPQLSPSQACGKTTTDTLWAWHHF